jgi:transcriptional regulator with XRE-family HTH domain
LRSTARRRTPGLRREDVADLAGVSVTWYTWLEQGRDIHCSIALVSRLGKALRLSRTDSDYLFRLAGYSPPSASAQVGTVERSVQAVFDAFAGPVLLTSPRLDIVAFNRQADRVFQLARRTGPFDCNHLWRGFMDEERRKIYVDWEQMMARAVSVLRANYATRIGQEPFETLIATLREQSTDFARLWEQHRTAPLDTIEVRLCVPELGRITFTSTRFLLPAPSDHVAFFLLPADEVTREAMSAVVP